MGHRKNDGISEPRGSDRRALYFRRLGPSNVGLLCIALLSMQRAAAQSNTAPGGALRTDKIDLPTPINQPPDANAQLIARQHLKGQQKFDAANALRQRQIVDESVKLLTLARDLKSQMDKIGDQPLPALLLREAEVIEILARDMQAKMTLTVGPG
jgi:hypothetical protein